MSMVVLLSFYGCNNDENVISPSTAGEEFVSPIDTSALKLLEQQLKHIDSLQSSMEALILKNNTRLQQRAQQSKKEEIFDVLFLSDTHVGMNGNDFVGVADNFEKILSRLRSRTLEYSDKTVVNYPDMALVAGDFGKDRNSPWDFELYSFYKLNCGDSPNLSNPIPVFLVPGNHDWDPNKFEDGSYGNTILGFLSNASTLNKVLEINSSSLAQLILRGSVSNIDLPRYVLNYNYRLPSLGDIWNDRNVGIGYATTPPVSAFTYKNVDFVFGGTCILDPLVEVSRYSLRAKGPAIYSEGIGEKFLADRAKRVETGQRLLIQHFPFKSLTKPGNGWQHHFNDGTNKSLLENRFVRDVRNAKVTAILSGHEHKYGIVKDDTLPRYKDETTKVPITGPRINNYYGNCIGYNAGKFTMIRISSTRGVLNIDSFSF